MAPTWEQIFSSRLPEAPQQQPMPGLLGAPQTPTPMPTIGWPSSGAAPRAPQSFWSQFAPITAQPAPQPQSGLLTAPMPVYQPQPMYEAPQPMPAPMPAPQPAAPAPFWSQFAPITAQPAPQPAAPMPMPGPEAGMLTEPMPAYQPQPASEAPMPTPVPQQAMPAPMPEQAMPALPQAPYTPPPESTFNPQPAQPAWTPTGGAWDTVFGSVGPITAPEFANRTADPFAGFFSRFFP